MKHLRISWEYSGGCEGGLLRPLLSDDRPPWLPSVRTYTKSTELFIEDQAFSPWYDLAPSPLPPLQLSLWSLCVSPIELTDGRGGRGWGRSRIYDDEKAWFSTNHSILSAYVEHMWNEFANNSVRAEMIPNGKKTLKLDCRNPYSSESTFQTQIHLRVSGWHNADLLLVQSRVFKTVM